MCDSSSSTDTDGNQSNSSRVSTDIHGASTSRRTRSKNGDPTHWMSHMPNMQRRILKMSNDLIEECKRSEEETMLSKQLRDELESYNHDVRREVATKMRNGCAPLFIACKRGCLPIVEYLYNVCDADVEQRGLYEVSEERTFHCVTPLWCAVVSGHLPIVRYLVQAGCDINATSDSGSTPVRSACFMSHIEIVKYLVEHGADIKKPNVNGGTCLINSVQSPALCHYLISKGANINAKDIQNKTALHYAIQEHRLETTKVLLESGAAPFAVSRYGDDALRTACLKGSHDIFDYLKQTLVFQPAQLAEAHELLGSTLLEDHNETRVAVLHWKIATHIRLAQSPPLEKYPKVPKRAAYKYAEEFTTMEELDNIALDVDALRMQSLLICERILGIKHKDLMYRIMFRGAAYADSLQMQRCIDMWRLLLEMRVTTNSILHYDTSYAAQALIRFMLDVYERNHPVVNVPGIPRNEVEMMRNNMELDERVNAANLHNHFAFLLRALGAPQQQPMNAESLPKFDDVFGVFELLKSSLSDAQALLQVRPVYRKQQENYDRILKCITHLIYLLNAIAYDFEQKKKVFVALKNLVEMDVRSACTNDSILHLCVSRLNVIKTGYITDDINVGITFPNVSVIKLLLDCGIDVNAKNEAKSTPLHVAAQPYNFCNSVVGLLLENGADIDRPNKTNDRPLNLIAKNSANTIPLLKFLNLKCMAATTISLYKIPYQNQIPKFLEDFVRQHEP